MIIDKTTTVPCEFGALIAQEEAEGEGILVFLRRPNGLNRQCARIVADENGIAVTTYVADAEPEAPEPGELAD